MISIHAPHAGRDGMGTPSFTSVTVFQSTRPMRGATPQLPPHLCHIDISIHAPHAGRDPRGPPSRPPCGYFNPRAPCGARPWPRSSRTRRPNFNPRAPCGARPDGPCPIVRGLVFQSTRPMRGATNVLLLRRWKKIFQSTRPMRGATRRRRPRWIWQSYFNPRAPCGARRSQ